MSGRRRYVLKAECDWPLQRFAEAPDLTLRALTVGLADRSAIVSHYAVWRLLAREEIMFKNGLHASERDRPDFVRRRVRWRRRQEGARSHVARLYR